jgi:hypothetical protein
MYLPDLLDRISPMEISEHVGRCTCGGILQLIDEKTGTQLTIDDLRNLLASVYDR